MNELLIGSLDSYTTSIKFKEKQIVTSFVEIGRLLKEVRDSKAYKEKYSEFELYIEAEGFQFSRRHADRLIQIANEFSDIDVSKLGITRCLDLLSLPISTREAIKEEISKPDADIESIQKAILDQKELLKDSETPLVDVVSPVVHAADNIETLDRALSYLSEELDNVFIGLEGLQQSSDDRLEIYGKDLMIYDLMTKDFPCKVNISNNTKGIKLSMLLRCVKSSQDIDTFDPHGIPKESIKEFAESLNYNDYSSLKKFANVFISAFGTIDKDNMFCKSVIFVPLYNIWFVNSHRFSDVDFSNRLKSIIANPLVIQYSRLGGYEAQIQLRKIMLDIMNKGYSKNLLR